MNTAVSTPALQPRQRRWFKSMVGKQVFLEATKYTSSETRRTMQQVKTVADERHAESLYMYHKDNKINFSEYNG